MSISAADYAAGLVHDRRSAATATTRDCAPHLGCNHQSRRYPGLPYPANESPLSHSQRHVAGSSAAH